MWVIVKQQVVLQKGSFDNLMYRVGFGATTRHAQDFWKNRARVGTS
jgi:hypothetical protein